MENNVAELTIKTLAEIKINDLINTGKDLDLEEVQVKRIMQDILNR
jgi:hypothetical protein